jgi:hypothetical protein
MLVKKVGIVEMRPPDEFDGMVAALSHPADLGNAHWKKNVRFHAFGMFSNAP